MGGSSVGTSEAGHASSMSVSPVDDENVLVYDDDAEQGDSVQATSAPAPAPVLCLLPAWSSQGLLQWSARAVEPGADKVVFLRVHAP